MMNLRTPDPARTSALDRPVTSWPGVGSRVAAKLRALKIETLRDLLFHWPHRYEDFTRLEPVAALAPGAAFTIHGTVRAITARPTRRRHLTVTEALISDTTGSVRAIWFNQPYLADTLKVGTPVALAGKVTRDAKGLVFSNPHFEVVGERDLVHTGRLVPVYPETAGLTSRWFRAKIRAILPLTRQLVDPLPAELLRGHGLLTLPSAVKAAHFPKTLKMAEAARWRLALDELVLIQLKVRQWRAALTAAAAKPLPFDEALMRQFVQSLPFTLTPDQRRAAWAILKDLSRPFPMNRLLEGDVGTGKTVVAAMAALQAAKARALTAFLVPTEILAFQHAAALRTLLKPVGEPIALLTHSRAMLGETGISRAALLKKIRGNETRIIIGTHALLSARPVLPPPALVIVDEQHRFGVRQRSELLAGEAQAHAHLLAMTATPIPRTLAMTIYSTLDVAILKTFPKGARQVTTRVVAPAKREAAYEFVRERVAQGEQVFVICPLVEESAAIAARAATMEYKRLKEGVLAGLKVGLLHGQLKSAAKEKVMADFSAGRIAVLVATPVVEVGIDVPRATTMIVESAERFGLAQLHQLRGRIGRGGERAFCLLFTDSANRDVLARLKVLTETNDGFALAEADLRRRGPGEFLGERQAGWPDLAMQHLSNPALVETAQTLAKAILENDPTLSRQPLLRAWFTDRTRHLALS